MTRRASALALALQPSLLLDEDAPATPVTPIIPIATHKTKVRAHRRTVPGAEGPTGQELKDAALDAHLASEVIAAAREYVRGQLAALYRHRVRWFANQPARHFVTADDAAEILDAWADCPAAIRELPSQKWRGAIFARGGWRQRHDIPRVKSARAGQHRNDLPCWALVEDRP